MTNFRDKAAEIKAAGVAERGNFEPTGAPLRVYNYWLSNTASAKGARIRRGDLKENFCHFWRVVAIWAPLMFLWNKAEAFFSSPVTLTFLGIAAVAGLVYGGFTSTSFMWFVLSVIGIALGVLACIAGFFWLEENWKSSWTVPVQNTLLGLVGLVGLAVVTLLLVLIYIDFGLMGYVYMLGIGAALVAGGYTFGFIGSLLSDFISGRRAVRNKAEDERVSAAYSRGEDPYAQEPYVPGKIANFFTGVGDFIIMIFQVVRVNKWKICPMVDVAPKVDTTK